MPINMIQHLQHLVEETLIILGGFLSLGTEVGSLAEMDGLQGFYGIQATPPKLSVSSVEMCTKQSRVQEGKDTFLAELSFSLMVTFHVRVSY